MDLQELLIHIFLYVAMKKANKDLLSKGEWRGWGSKLPFKAWNSDFESVSCENQVSDVLSPLQSLHGLIFVCMKWASKGPGALWLFTAFWDQCVCGSSSSVILGEWVGKVGWSQPSPVSCLQALPLQDVWGHGKMVPSSVRPFWLGLDQAVWTSPDVHCTPVWPENEEPHILRLCIALAC